MLIGQDQTVLFQGDSITDCGRPRDESDWHLGLGYAQLIASYLPLRHPKLGVRFVNRGIGGDRVPSLQARWQADCIDIQPDWISILIGINDASMAATEDQADSTAAYEAGYRDLLTQIRDRTEARLIILQPFLLETEHPYDFMATAGKIRQKLNPMIDVARNLAAEFDAVTVPLDDLFRQATQQAPAEHWAPDAIHPSPAGHALIAEAWMRAVGAI